MLFNRCYRTTCKKVSRAGERIKLHSLPENKGVANARNIALQNAVGRYIAFLDSDVFGYQKNWKNSWIS